MEIKGSNVNSKLKIKEDLQIGKKLAKEIMLFADDNSSAVSKKEFQNKLNKMEKLSTQNLIKFIRSFDKDESVIELIVDEVGSSKDERKNACKKVLNALVNKAKELGIDTFDFENQFNTELNIQFRMIGFVNTEKLDSIINALTQAIENRQNFTEEDIYTVKNTPAAEGQEQANGIIENRLEKAYSAFGERVGEDGKMTTKDKYGKTYNGQMQRDGIAADIADGVSRIWGSENTAAKVRKDLKASNAQLQQLKEAKLQGEEAYKAKFKEIFGIEYDYANMVAYQKAEATYINASANHEFEMSFNRTLKTLLSPAPLHEEVRYDSPDPMTNMVITTVTATKSQVYSREFNNLAEFLTQKDSNGNEIKGSEILNKAFEEKGVANGTIEEKFEVLKQIAQALSKQLHSATLEAGGGKEFSEVQTMYDNSYKAAYGVENDIMKRVTDYNVSQEMGAGVVKASTAIAVSLIAAFTGVGLVGVAAWTAGATVATEVIDRGTSGNALNALREQGLGEYLKTVSKDVDWEATLKQAAMSGTAVLIGGGVAQGVTAIMKGSSSVAQFAAMLGSDVITDATMEFFMTKQITWEGMVFTILLSTIGNTAQLKQMKNATTTNAAKGFDNALDVAKHHNTQIAREFMDLPPVREGYIRLVHRTSSEAAESIAKSGLYSAQGLDDTASAMRSATDFQNFLTSGAKEHRQATTVVIMDMPIEEFRILSRGSISDTYNPYGNSHIYYSEKAGISNNGYKNPKYLVCPAKYVVGICEHAENLPIQEVNRITLQNAKNPLPQVEETDLTIFDRFKVSEQELEIEDSWFDLNSSVETTNKKVTSNLSSSDTEVGNDMLLKAAREKLKRDLVNRGETINQKNNNLTNSNTSGYVDEFGQIHRKPPRGYVIDSKTGQPIKVNINKATIEVSENSISISDEFGNLLGHVSVDGGGVILKDGSKALHFQGLVSNVEGVGIGTKLIQELVKISEARGFEGRLIATASSMRADKLTNLGFYYKLGFKATDTQKHTAILDCIKNNKEITIELNHNTEIVFVPPKRPATTIGEPVVKANSKSINAESEFQHTVIDKSLVETMSDVEFNELKAQIESNPKFPKFNSNFQITRLSKNNIELAQRLIENTELIEKLGRNNLCSIIDESLHATKYQIEAKIALLDILESNPELMNNPKIQNMIAQVFNGVESMEALKVANKLFETPELLEKLFNIGTILKLLNNESSVKTFEKLLAVPDLSNNSYNISNILRVANNDYSLQFLERILKEQEILNSNPNYISNLITKTEFKMINETKMELFNEWVKNPNYLSDENLTANFFDAISKINEKTYRYEKILKEGQTINFSKLDFETVQRGGVFENLFLYLPEHVSSKFYDMYLEKAFLQYTPVEANRFRQMCKSINEEYGVKVILPSNLKEVGQSLILIYQELNNYKMHSKGCANMPPILSFITPYATTGGKTLAGEAATLTTREISICQLTTADIKHTLRHEIAHINDTKLLDDFPIEIRTFNKNLETDWSGKPKFDVDVDLDIDNCKYVEEFREAGITEYLVRYAYTDPKEFIAVASQGDFSKYSPEFKNYLVELGMPEWMLNFQNLKPYFINGDS